VSWQKGWLREQAPGRERETAPSFLCVPSPLELGPLSISLILVRMCLAAVRRDEGAKWEGVRGERAAASVGAGARNLIFFASAVWSGPGHEGKRGKKGRKVGKAAEARLHLRDG
jgi:hypothetical protein